jgi:exosortase A
MNTLASPQQGLDWRRLAPGIVLLLAAVLLFRSTAQAMVHIWNTSDTYAHAFLVVPISLWLVWRLRASLAALPTQTMPWMLLPMALVALLWLLGELAAAQALTQFALVALLVLSVPAVLGWPVTQALLFPLLFLFFAVPVGDFMVPQMMEWTADFTVAALQMTGIPVYREGLQFVVPTGNWSVVSACSGVRYLIASFMVGTLFAYLNFKGLRRRTLFIVMALLVPILANWLRAYMIVMIGHLSGNKLAVGVDHIIYGWVFFGLVIGVMFWVGSRFSDLGPESDETPSPPAPTWVAVGARPQSAWWVGAVALALMLAAQTAASQLNADKGAAVPVVSLPETYGDWQAAEAVSDWVPEYKHAKAVMARSFTSGADRAAVWVGYYRDQGYNKKMVTSSNRLVAPIENAVWASSALGERDVMVPGLGVHIALAEVRSSLAPLAAGAAQAQRLRVWYSYWIGGRFVANDTQARLLMSMNRLMGKGDDAAILIFYTPVSPAAEYAQADALLQRFVSAVLPPLSRQLDATALQR